MATTALSIHDLKFRYANSADAPWVASIRALELGAGEQMLLTATSGRGKSTLLLLIAGLLEPQHGSISISGQNVHDLSGAARDRFRGRHIGMIFQTFNLLSGFSALENVEAALLFAHSPAARSDSLARNLLASLSLTEINRPVDLLSIGQQQRVAVARAVALRPTIVLADEPTASLDPENAAAAMTLIQGACRECGAALLCVSHDPAMQSRFSRRATLEEIA